ncbi:MAG: SgcJ/EcaC family oxidoreductase [Pseudomonadota bacterium]
MTDEQAIRQVIATWMSATRAGDVDQVLKLMTEDVVFLVAGQPPMYGREGFAASLRPLLQTHRIESDSTVEDIAVSGDMAYCWTRLTVSVTPLAGGKAMRRSGTTLSVFRRNGEGVWQLARDANLLVAVQE